MTEEKNAALFKVGSIYRDQGGDLVHLTARFNDSHAHGPMLTGQFMNIDSGPRSLVDGRYPGFVEDAASRWHLIPGELDAQGNPLSATPHHTAGAEQQARNEAIRGAIEAVKVTKPTPAEVTKPAYTLHQHWSDKHGSGTCGVACGASLSRRWAR